MLPAISDADVQPLRVRKNRLVSGPKGLGRTPAALPLVRNKELCAIHYQPFASLTTMVSRLLSSACYSFLALNSPGHAHAQGKMTTPKEIFHPDFNDPDADFVIECKDGIKLKVHSYILKAHRLVDYP
jgi:hypothetical protein